MGLHSTHSRPLRSKVQLLHGRDNIPRVWIKEWSLLQQVRKYFWGEFKIVVDDHVVNGCELDLMYFSVWYGENAHDYDDEEIRDLTSGTEHGYQAHCKFSEDPLSYLKDKPLLWTTFSLQVQNQKVWACVCSISPRTNEFNATAGRDEYELLEWNGEEGYCRLERSRDEKVLEVEFGWKELLKPVIGLIDAAAKNGKTCR